MIAREDSVKPGGPRDGTALENPEALLNSGLRYDFRNFDTASWARAFAFSYLCSSVFIRGETQYGHG
jgi:hypothetical protein